MTEVDPFEMLCALGRVQRFSFRSTVDTDAVLGQLRPTKRRLRWLRRSR